MSPVIISTGGIICSRKLPLFPGIYMLIRNGMLWQWRDGFFREEVERLSREDLNYPY